MAAVPGLAGAMPSLRESILHQSQPALGVPFLHPMSKPLLSEVLPDLVEEMVFLLRERGAEPLCDQLRALHIESICDCGDENCASFATAPEVKVASTVELQAMEGFLIV